ncbi:hypothetical protein CSOJ01_09011 [Colletotrichum sojae]|uniref:Uncharacterized protein n=1 Tax=Colletotrichum sojae TaxID=2175907 RepID=A0A8H6J411_9PEZI|nr:hypothetical protein CSOJ01_09011 [Colletotrichum sojae]
MAVLPLDLKSDQGRDDDNKQRDPEVRACANPEGNQPGGEVSESPGFTPVGLDLFSAKDLWLPPGAMPCHVGSGSRGGQAYETGGKESICSFVHVMLRRRRWVQDSSPWSFRSPQLPKKLPPDAARNAGSWTKRAVYGCDASISWLLASPGRRAASEPRIRSEARFTPEGGASLRVPPPARSPAAVPSKGKPATPVQNKASFPRRPCAVTADTQVRMIARFPPSSEKGECVCRSAAYGMPEKVWLHDLQIRLSVEMHAPFAFAED